MTPEPKDKQDWKEKFNEWASIRTAAISKMFDNKNEFGIYPTTKFFNTIDEAFINFIQPLQQSNEALQKEVDTKDAGIEHLQRLVKEWEDKWTKFSESLQKENASLKNQVEELSKQAMLSPIETERIFQERQMKDIFPNYPDGFKFQYLTGLIMLAKESLNYQRQRNGLQQDNLSLSKVIAEYKIQDKLNELM